jgi:hypothetical protein
MLLQVASRGPAGSRASGPAHAEDVTPPHTSLDHDEHDATRQSNFDLLRSAYDTLYRRYMRLKRTAASISDRNGGENVGRTSPAPPLPALASKPLEETVVSTATPTAGRSIHTVDAPALGQGPITTPTTVPVPAHSNAPTTVPVPLVVPPSTPTPEAVPRRGPPDPTSSSSRARALTVIPPNRHVYEPRPSPAQIKYAHESVRKRAARERLQGFDCAQCQGFYDAIQAWGGGASGEDTKDENGWAKILREKGCPRHPARDTKTTLPSHSNNGNHPIDHHHYHQSNHSNNRNHPSRKKGRMVDEFSRHRFEFEPQCTPDGFWEMGFADEKGREGGV